MSDFDGNKLKELMNQHSLTIAVAESLTTGNIQAMIGSISGSSTFFEGGITVYTLDQKVRHLGVNREHASQVNSVSERVAAEMAKGVSLKFNSDIGIGTTGYAESYPTQNVTSPYAYFAIWRRVKNEPDGLFIAKELVEGGDRKRIEMQRYLSEKVLITLLKYLQQI